MLFLIEHTSWICLAAAYLFSLELLEAVLPVLGKLDLLALARLGQSSLDLHLPPATPAQQESLSVYDIAIRTKEMKNGSQLM